MSDSTNTMSPRDIVEFVVADQLKAEGELPYMSPGDTVDVHYRIIEGEKERLQVFQGVLLSLNSQGINRTMTVRRIVANEGVERIFPINSPRLAHVEVVRRGDARRSKLYFLRDRIGKARRLRDQRRGQKHVQAWEQTHADRVADAKKRAEDPTDGAEGANEAAK